MNPLHKLLDHFARVGGVLISPRKTLARIVAGEGTLLELVPWIIFVTAAIAPVETGRAILMLRVDLLEGLLAFANVLSARMAPALAGALGAGIALYLGEMIFSSAPPEERLGLDRSLDATSFTLVPYLFLAIAGALLSHAGIEWWFMPHRALRGGPYYQFIRLAVSFGWPAILWLWVARLSWRRRAAADTPARA